MSLSDQFFNEGIDLLNGGELTRKLEGINKLALVQDRRSYSPLINLAQDVQLGPSAIIALANTSNSQALFPLINVFLETDQSAIQQRILQYIAHTGDPRAIPFLEEDASGGSFADLVESALESCMSSTGFNYRYNGSDEYYHAALHVTGQIVVTNKELTNAKDRIIANELGRRCEVPQTYVLPSGGPLLIGGIINEHVDVARGQDLLACGELTVEEESPGVWVVKYINNRSNGYYPDGKKSFEPVREFLRDNDVKFDKTTYDQVFPQNGYNDSDFLSVQKFGRHF